MARYPFGGLPAELLFGIVRDPNISHSDLKELRLSSRALADITTSRLFERICISKTWRDRSAFCSIAATPHLAKAVRAIVWCELAEGPPDLLEGEHETEARVELRLNTEVRFSRGSRALHFPSDENDELREHIFKKSQSSFWWPIVAAEPDSDSYEELMAGQVAAQETFFPEFLTAIRAMPNLSQFVSEPMDPLRVLHEPDGEYSLTAQLLYSTTNYLQPPTTAPNLGLRVFLLPAMDKLARDPPGSPSPRITRLRAAQEGWPLALPRSSGSTPSTLRPFGNLTHLDLEIDLNWFGWMQEDGQHCASPSWPCLEHATQLTHLRLSLDRVPTEYYLNCLPVFPRLEALAIEHFPCSRSSLLAFVAKHAKTLRQFHLDAGMTPGDLQHEIAEVAPRARIFIHEGESRPELEEYNPWAGWNARAPTGNDQARTSRPPHVSPKFLQWWEESESWAASGAQATTEGHAAEDFVDVAMTEDDVMGEFTAGEPQLPLEDDDRALYAREHVSYLRNRGKLLAEDGIPAKPEPRWLFARNRGGNFFYRQAHPELEQGGFPTENWAFTHRNGETTWGQDPLEYWSDWEGSDAGDVQEPIPHGWQLMSALRTWEPNQGWLEMRDRQRNLQRVSEGIPLTKSTASAVHDLSTQDNPNQFFQHHEKWGVDSRPTGRHG